MILGYFLLAFGYMHRGATTPDTTPADPNGVIWMFALFLVPPMILLWARATLVRYRASLSIHMFAWLMGAGALVFLASALGLLSSQ